MTKQLWWSWALLLPTLASAALIDAASAQAETLNPDQAPTEAALVESTESTALTESTDRSGAVPPRAVLSQAPATDLLADLPAVEALPATAPSATAAIPNAVSPTATPAEAAPAEARLDLPAAPVQLAQAAEPSNLAQAQQYSSPAARSTPGMGQVTSVNQLSANQQPNRAMSQLTSVTQLSDVQPTDWAYQALQSLVERYGCIVGYPDSTYRGQRALTRFEFAAGMNACLDRISELLAASTADLATKEDLATLQRLQEEFAAELAALRGRVDELDARTTALEANQFSTTTKLGGETLFFVSDIFNEDEGFENQTTVQARVRLIFDSSFTGRDLLRARLQAGNLQPFDQPGFDLGFGAVANTGGDFRMDLLSYQFPVGDFARINLFANGGGLDDATFGNTINPLDNPARSAITRFGQRNPIYRTAQTSAGAAINFLFTENISLQAAYLAGENSDPNPGAGLLNGNYGALGQLTFRNIFDVVDLAFTYVNAYTGTAPNADGSTSAGVPFGLGSRFSRVDVDRPVIANSYGVEANFKILKGLQIGGWAGYSHVRALGLGDADVWSYAGTLALPDLLGRGNLAGLIVGMQPRLTGSDSTIGDVLGSRKDPDVGLHVEAFYRWALNDNIDITPGFIWATAPNHNSDNNDLFMGVVRTTFRF
jgi:hypothetical protein